MEASFVTILFADLVGSASLFERRGHEEADAVRPERFAELRRASAEHGGREVRSTGEGLMLAFSSAVSAIRCAVDMQRALSVAAGGMQLRVGLDAGEPLPDCEALYGTPVIVAARLCETAGAERSSRRTSCAGSRDAASPRRSGPPGRHGCAASPSAWRLPR